MLATGTIVDEIEELREERRAVILAHHYQESEIQELAGRSAFEQGAHGLDTGTASRKKQSHRGTMPRWPPALRGRPSRSGSEEYGDEYCDRDATRPNPGMNPQVGTPWCQPPPRVNPR